MLVVASTEAELDEVRAVLEGVRFDTVLGRPLQVGRVGAVEVAVLVSGIGKVNAAMTTAVALQAHPADLVVCLGVGGGFAEAGDVVGSLVVATSEHYGDEGVETEDRWHGLEAIGIPLLVVDGRSYFNTLPVHEGYSARLLACAERIAPAWTGAFVTVSTVTGTSSKADMLRHRFEAVCENMEGAAVAHVCLAQGVPFTEVRGISNPVGPRQRDLWQLDAAAQVAQRAVLKFLQEVSLDASAARSAANEAGALPDRR